MIAAGVIKINIWFSVPVPKIKFNPPPQGKNALVLIFEGFDKINNFFPDVEISLKLNFVSTPWKIIIPPWNHVGDHI